MKVWAQWYRRDLTKEYDEWWVFYLLEQISTQEIYKEFYPLKQIIFINKGKTEWKDDYINQLCRLQISAQTPNQTKAHYLIKTLRLIESRKLLWHTRKTLEISCFVI